MTNGEQGSGGAIEQPVERAGHVGERVAEPGDKTAQYTPQNEDRQDHPERAPAGDGQAVFAQTKQANAICMFFSNKTVVGVLTATKAALTSPPPARTWSSSATMPARRKEARCARVCSSAP
jgi:hypothetical protein